MDFPLPSAMSLGRVMKCDNVLGLPAELRARIYRYAVARERPINVSKKGPEQGLEVLQTCRTFRAEATQFYYQENTFLVEDAVAVLTWLQRIESHKDRVRRVALEVDVSPIDQLLWSILGVGSNGHDLQWKQVIPMLGEALPALEELSLVVVAHRLQALHTGAEPRPLRYSHLIRELGKVHLGKSDWLQGLERSCPKFCTLHLLTGFPMDWIATYGALSFKLVEIESADDFDGMRCYEIQGASEEEEEGEEEEEENEDQEQDQEHEDEIQDEFGVEAVVHHYDYDEGEGADEGMEEEQGHEHFVELYDDVITIPQL